MLHGRILVNGHTITGYRIIRKAGQPYALPDQVFEYKWEVQKLYRGALYRADGEIKHRYGDGAEVLVSKVLKLAAPQLEVQFPPETDGE